MKRSVIAVLDANILYPAPIRDLFVRLGQKGLFKARWTDAIHTEWTRSVLRDNPRLEAKRLERTCRMMDSAIRDCLVTGYEALIDTLVLPDPDDRHVLAAAIQAGASRIVTFNLRDFPKRALLPHGVVSVHPDLFAETILDAKPDAVGEVVVEQHQALKNPPMTMVELLERLANAGLPRFAARLHPG